MKHISSSQLSVSRCREKKQERTVNLCIKSESWHAVKKKIYECVLRGLKLFV